ncbi:MAG: T9SS type A sorting domain-containing protein [Ignavibacteria bacterium]|jgi:hypothetical protein|nr:T9SS type A sorting domain-containing protein [Ignavibacteria bacterium]
MQTNYLIKQKHFDISSAATESPWILSLFAKSKLLLFTLCTCILFAAGFSQAKAQMYTYCGPVDGNGNPTSAAATSYTSGWFSGFYSHERLLTTYTAVELGSKPMYITSLAIHLDYKYNSYGQYLYNCGIFIRNVSGNLVPTWPAGITTEQNSTEAGWGAAGFATVLAGQTFDYNMPLGWTSFTLATPFYYDGTSNLQVVFIADCAGTPGASSSCWSTNLMLGWRKYVETGNPTRSIFSYSDNGGSTQIGYMGGTSTNKHTLRIGYFPLGVTNAAVSPGDNNALPKGNLVNPASPQYNVGITKFSFDMKDITDASLQHEITYQIIGPEPLTDVVYEMVDPNNTANKYIRITKNNGVGANYTYNYNIQRAVGPYVWTTGTGADNKSIDLRDVNVVKAGKYTTRLKIQTLSSLPQYVEPAIKEDKFWIVVNNDLAVDAITSPGYLKDYPIGGSTGVTISAVFRNAGLNPINDFYARANIYEAEYDLQTGKTTRGKLVDVLPHKDLYGSNYYHWTAPLGTTGIPEPLLNNNSTILSEKHFVPAFIAPSHGYFDIEVIGWMPDSERIVTYLKDSLANVASWKEDRIDSLFAVPGYMNSLLAGEIVDQEVTNNVYPISGLHHVIRAQYEVDPELIRFITPIPGFVTSLGRTLNITATIRNNGLVDISDKDNVLVTYTITRRDPVTNQYTEIVFQNTQIVEQAGTNEGEIRVYCSDSITKDLRGWLVNKTGDYIIEAKLEYKVAPQGWTCQNDRITMAFSVRPALHDEYTIGANGDYSTIRAAVDDLYLLGVSAPVTFILTDDEYNESAWADNNVDRENPAVDLRSQIPGVVVYMKDTKGNYILDTKGNRIVSSINDITFKPSPAKSIAHASIRINLESLTGVGMWIGRSNDITSVPNAMINSVTDKEKKALAHNDGYITWDGGINKSILFTFKRPQGVAAIPEFRAPIYITNCSNVTIANCVIQDGINQPRSYSYMLPGNTYNGPNVSWINDWERMSGVSNKTYSAGIVVRALPPTQDRFEENKLGIDTLPCSNIILRGNEISKFTYGIVDIGLNFRLLNQAFLVDIKDTLRNLTKIDLDNNGNLTYIGSTTIVDGNANTSTNVLTYRHTVRPSLRSYLYYRMYNVTSTITGATSSYVLVIDSSNGGIGRAANHNNTFENNLLFDLGRAGIFCGNDENTTISGNRIYGITGHVVDDNNQTQDANVDCGGIILGGRQRENGIDGFYNLGMKIFKNEISNMASARAINGIIFEQSLTIEGITSMNIQFPDAKDRTQIYSNIISGFMPLNANVDRYGINLKVSHRTLSEEEFATGYKPEDTLYYAVSDPTYYFDQILVANNTIVMEEDNYQLTSGDYFGIRSQKVKNGRILNNAVELQDSTLFYNRLSEKYAAAIYYQGPAPEEANVTINYNDYAFNSNSDVPVDAYRYVNTDFLTGTILDYGYRGEFKDLTQWQNWMHTDFFSNNKPFAKDLVNSNENFPKLRIPSNPLPVNNPLDNAGTAVPEVTSDIDGRIASIADQKIDIGAQAFDGAKYGNDLEVMTITDPSTYHAAAGPFKDAEYFMIENKPITIKTLIRNNGNSNVINKPINLRVYEESAVINNSVADVHYNNYTDKYWNKENQHMTDNSIFAEIPNTATPIFNATQNISIPAGGSIEIEFALTAPFRTYGDINGGSNTYSVPIQFSNMFANVTPRYKFTVTSTEIDEDNTNNYIEKYARFYIKKSTEDMLVVAYNTFNNIYTNVGGVQVPDPKVTNVDMVAGKLNLDSLKVGLKYIGKEYSMANESDRHDYDILDRKAWDYRNIDFTIYKTLFIADELKIDSIRWVNSYYDFTHRTFQDKWYIQNLTSFLIHNKVSTKSNLIMASEEFISDIHDKHGFLSLDHPMKLALANDFFKTSVYQDSVQVMQEDSTYVTVFKANKTAIYQMITASYGIPPVDTLLLDPYPYRFTTENATLTGNSILFNPLATNNGKIHIKTTGWAWNDGAKLLTDAPPYGVQYLPLNNVTGSNAIGFYLDTLTNPGNKAAKDIPPYQKAAAITSSTLTNNIILLGFDWRHFGDIAYLFIGIKDYLNHYGDGDNTNLPIALYDWNAAPVANNVLLNWKTAPHNDILSFNIERANVNNNSIGNFYDILSIPANTDNSIDNEYNSKDANLAYSTTYAYRLKLNDFNGNFNYSDTRIVNIEDAPFYVSDVNPNPVNNTASFNISSDAEQFITAAIYDLAGREVANLLNATVKSGITTINFNANNLPSGSYNIIVRTDNDMITKSFTVTK